MTKRNMDLLALFIVGVGAVAFVLHLSFSDVPKEPPPSDSRYHAELAELQKRAAQGETNIENAITTSLIPDDAITTPLFYSPNAPSISTNVQSPR